MKPNVIKVALVDDHILLRRGLAGMIDQFENYSVVLEADNGQKMIDMLSSQNFPDLILLDINMPVKDGYQTAQWLKENHPQIKVLALSMYDSEPSIIKMLKNGARGYLLKDTDPNDFKTALNSVIEKGFHYSEIVSGRLIHAVNNLDRTSKGNDHFQQLNQRETEFLKWSCTELTYKEIAEKMNLSPRTIDGYRDALFDKLNIKTRVGLVLYAIRHNIYLI